MFCSSSTITLFLLNLSFLDIEQRLSYSTRRLSKYEVTLLLFYLQKLHSYVRDQDGHRAIFTKLVPFSSWPMGAAQRPRLVIC
jgi:hypothetical protein